MEELGKLNLKISLTPNRLLESYTSFTIISSLDNLVKNLSKDETEIIHMVMQFLNFIRELD